MNQWENEYRTLGEGDRIPTEKALVHMYNRAVRELHSVSRKFEECERKLFDLKYKTKAKQEPLQVKLIEDISPVNFQREVNEFLNRNADKIKDTQYSVTPLGKGILYTIAIYYKGSGLG